MNQEKSFYDLVTDFLTRLVMSVSSGFLVRFVSSGENIESVIANEGLSKRGVKIFFELRSSDGTLLDSHKWFELPSSNDTTVLKLRVTLAAAFGAAMSISAGEILDALIKGINNKAAFAGDWTLGFENDAWGPHRSDIPKAIDFMSADFMVALSRAEGSEGAWASPNGLCASPTAAEIAQLAAPRGKGRKAKEAKADA